MIEKVVISLSATATAASADRHPTFERVVHQNRRKDNMLQRRALLRVVRVDVYDNVCQVYLFLRLVS